LGYGSRGFRSLDKGFTDFQRGALTHVFVPDTRGIVCASPVMYRHELSVCVRDGFTDAHYAEIVAQLTTGLGVFVYLTTAS
jgi:hypothetical protein